MSTPAYVIVEVMAYLGLVFSILMNLFFLATVAACRSKHLAENTPIFFSYSILCILVVVSFFITQPVFIIRDGYLYIIPLNQPFNPLTQLYAYVSFRVLQSMLFYSIPIGFTLRYLAVVRNHRIGLPHLVLLYGGFGLLSAFNGYKMFDVIRDARQEDSPIWSRHRKIVNDYLMGYMEYPTFYVIKARALQKGLKVELIVLLVLLFGCWCLQYLIHRGMDKLANKKRDHRRILALTDIAHCNKAVGVIIIGCLYSPYLICMMMVRARKYPGVYAIPVFLGASYVPFLVPWVLLNGIHEYRRSQRRLVRILKSRFSYQTLTNTSNSSY